MATDLAQFIQSTRLCDTHEHLKSEDAYVERGPDLLQSLFGNYVGADLLVARASQSAVDWLVNGKDEGLLDEAEAIALAARFMCENQYACFRLAEKKQAVVAAAQSARTA